MKNLSQSRWHPNVRRLKSMHGAILFLAVGSIAVLSILALGASSSISQELRVVKFLTDSNASFYYALSAIDVAKVFLRNDATPLTITFYDLRPESLSLDDKTIEINLSDEGSRVNLKTAPIAVLMRLPGLYGNEPLANAIKARPPFVKEDILLLEGMTPEMYAELKDYVTIFGSGGVNINTAQPEVLTALGIEKDIADKIKVFRAGDDGAEGTKDDGIFTDSSNIVTVLEGLGLTESARIVLDSLIVSGQLVTASSTIDLNITVKKVKVLKTFKITMDLMTGAIFSWDEE